MTADHSLNGGDMVQGSRGDRGSRPDLFVTFGRNGLSSFVDAGFAIEGIR
jgi:hypothetical protein